MKRPEGWILQVATGEYAALESQLLRQCRGESPEGEETMLHWSLVFLIIAIIAAVLGFGGIAGASADIAKILFFVFLVVWLVAFMFGRRAV